jgi:hypothetical protein
MRFRRMVRVSVACVVVSALAACFPWPHRDQQAPALNGTIQSAGKPAPPMPVGLGVDGDDPCASRQTTQTDPAGHFHFDATTSFAFFIWFGDRMDTWSLCFHLPSGPKVVWKSSGWWGGPEQEILSCDFTAWSRGPASQAVSATAAPQDAGDACHDVTPPTTPP